ncbi:divergent PAP2 family protein [Anaerofilum sp. BX8]|uniref:Divergent PAP2 family protein n=1 Tax=Anaerofilum hominis TaxID=2763016 RepID=A0A923I414_9FIRM|nr:divergent PAP2 family protein [Anaerofilum hominis]MBC5579940.1 divergent PAP2 family protein [Anaerofilum hominis]
MQKLCGFLACNYILYVPLLSWLAAQICKTIIDLFLTGKLDLERMFGAGGMPSAHSALVCSMTIATARKFGVSSPFFAFAFILAAIVMYDAMGVRRAAGEQAKVLNRIVDDWMNEEDDEENPLRENGKRLKEKVGHTPFEVLSGALLGILMAMIFPVT